MGDYHDYDLSVDVGKIGPDRTVGILYGLLKDIVDS